MEKFTVSLLLILSITICVHSSNLRDDLRIEVSGEQNGIWNTGETYQVVGNITVNSGDTLLIEPGVTIEAMGDFEILVHGTLQAVGTDADSIIFTSGQSSPDASDWKGILFEQQQSSEGIIAHCIMEYCDRCIRCLYGANPEIRNNTFRYNQISISTYQSIPLLENNAFSDSGRGIFLHDTIVQALVQGNTFTGNEIGITCDDATFCLLENNCFTDNEGCGIDLWHADVEIYKNVFTGSMCGIFSDYSSASMSGNLFEDCQWGIWANDISDNCLNINKNTFGNCEFGIYLDDLTGESLIRNNIFSNNATGISCSSAFFMNFSNNLFWENNTNAIGSIFDGNGVINTVNCNNDPCDKFYNIFLDPLFLDPLNLDYHLSEDSPAINAGCDDPDYYDPDGTIADMGAYYFPAGPAIPQAAFIADQFFGSCPFTVNFQNLSSGDIENFHWDFGDGYFSSEMQPVHEYTANGLYSVTLTIDGAGGNDIFTRIDYIEVRPQVEVAGIIQGLWTSENTYRITDDIHVVSGTTLEIEPGTQIRFMGAYVINVEGTLQAIGTETDSIRFLSKNSQPARGDWQGIEFSGESSSGSSIEYALLTSGNVTILCENSSPVISHCRISDCFNGINGINASPEITYNLISKCRTHSIMLYASGAGLIMNNEFADNYSGIFLWSGSTPLITENIFRRHHFSMISCQETSPEISYNTFTEFYDAIQCYGSEANIHHNLFSYGNNNAIEVRQSASPVIYNNTFCNSACAIDFWGAESAEIINNIFYGNETAISSEVFLGTLNYNLFYLNLNNFDGDTPVWLGSITGVNYNDDPCDNGFNIFMSPLVVDAENSDYHLTESSPCIDAGNPDEFYNDPDYTISDIGAFYYQLVVDNEDDNIPVSDISLTNYPNPFNPSTTIVFNLPKPEICTLKIYNIKGELVKTLLSENLKTGKHTITWDGKDDHDSLTTSGVYFYQLKTGDRLLTKRMLLLK